MKHMKKQNIIFNDLLLDTEQYSKEVIEGCVGIMLTQKGQTLPFNYEKKEDGYEFSYQRDLPYGYIGDFILDRDCAFITGLGVEKFQVNPLDPTHKPLVFGILGRNTDGFYVLTEEFEKLYAAMIGFGSGKKPSEVKVDACDTYVKVRVKY